MTDDEKRKSIVDAAKRRFQHYGYAKTTMAEIAVDAGMSVGSLYLHFKNKEAIVHEFSRYCGEAFYNKLAPIVNGNLTPPEKLVLYMKTATLTVKEGINRTPGDDVFTKLVLEEKSRQCENYKNTCKGFLATMLQEGVDSGFFEISDIKRAAAAYHNAFGGFMHPAALNQPDDVLVGQIEDLSKLLLNGLANQ